MAKPSSPKDERRTRHTPHQQSLPLSEATAGGKRRSLCCNRSPNLRSTPDPQARIKARIKARSQPELRTVSTQGRTKAGNRPDGARANLVPINVDDEIRRLAYLLADRRGFQSGHETEDWLNAEREFASATASKALESTALDRCGRAPAATWRDGVLIPPNPSP